MVNYICPKCNKVFKQKSHYVEHTENKKYPCDKSDFLVAPNCSNLAPNCSKIAPEKYYTNIIDMLDITKKKMLMMLKIIIKIFLVYIVIKHLQETPIYKDT